MALSKKEELGKTRFWLSVQNVLINYQQQIRLIKRFRLKLILAFAHALFLVIFTLVLQNLTLTRSDETGFLKLVAIFKHNILRFDRKPADKEVVFIDVSKDVVTIDDPEFSYDGDDSIQGARFVIKDRKKLAIFLKEVSKHPGGYKYIICDILFDNPSPDDVDLKPVIEALPRFLATGIYDKGNLIRPIFNIRWGCVNYDLLNGSLFTKMPLMYSDSIKSLPLIIYEDVTKNKVTHSHWTTFFNGRPSFNTIIPELYYRPYDLRRSAEKGKPANLFYLGELLTKKGFFQDYLKDKFIVIGDFANDNHSTYMGPVPGCLLLFDSYLTLQQQSPIISKVWLLTLYFIYFVTSYLMFIHPEKKFEDITKKVKFPYLKKLVIKYLSFVGLMILIDLISYLFYSTFVSVFYIASYLTLLGAIVEKYPDVMRKIKIYIKKIRLIKTGLLIGLLMPIVRSNAQTYTVSAVRGTIYWNNKIVKNGDVLTNPQILTSADPSAKIRLLNPQTGSVLISFVNSQPVTTLNKSKHSELYELTIQKYISQYSASRVLTTRGDFDWILFFIDSCKGKMVIFENEKIPLKSAHIKLDSSVRFTAVIFSTKDSVEKKLEVKNDSLILGRDISPSEKKFRWKLKMSYVADKTIKTFTITDTPITSRMISNAELKGLISDFANNWRANYQNEEELKEDFYTYILFTYGVFYNGNLNELIDNILATR